MRVEAAVERSVLVGRERGLLGQRERWGLASALSDALGKAVDALGVGPVLAEVVVYMEPGPTRSSASGGQRSLPVLKRPIGRSRLTVAVTASTPMIVAWSPWR